MNADPAAARELAANLLPFLPSGWILAPIPDVEWLDYQDLIRSDGATMRIRIGGWRREGRVTVHGIWPKGRDGYVHTSGPGVEITCSAKRSPEQIAGDIRRRFLAAYDAAYTAAVKIARQDDASNEEAGAVAERIALVVGGSLDERRRRRGEVHVLGYHLEAVSRLMVRPGYETSVHSDNCRVDLEVHGLDPETAARVLEIIRESEQRGGAGAESVRVAPPPPEPAENVEVEEDEDAPAPRARLAGGT